MKLRLEPSRALQPLLAAAIIGCLVYSSTAYAGTLTGVGQDPPPPEGPFEGDNEQGDMIMVGSASEPVPITPDPTAPPWTKDFVINRDGQGWATDGELSMVPVMEFLTFLPGSSSTGEPVQIIDWHEDIDTTFGDGENFKWAGGTIEMLGSSSDPIPGEVSDDGKSIWFEFPPFPPDTVVKVNKQLMWAGSGPITPGPSGENDYRIRINEQPSVPEPSALLLTGLAMLAFVSFESRNRKLNL